MSIKIYEISAQMRDVQQRIDTYAEEHDGLIPEDMDALYTGLEYSSVQCRLDIAKRYKELTAEADAIAETAKRIQARSRAIYNHAEYLKSVLISHCSEGEVFTDDAIKISWRKSSAVEITDENSIPDTWCVITRTPNKLRIKEVLATGADIIGARMVEKQNIQIK